MCQFIVVPWSTTRGKKRGKGNIVVHGAQLEGCMVLDGVCRELLYTNHRQQHKPSESYGKRHESNKIHSILHKTRVVVSALV